MIDLKASSFQYFQYSFLRTIKHGGDRMVTYNGVDMSEVLM